MPDEPTAAAAAAAAAPMTRAHSFHLAAPVGRVLPLFTAEGERAWAPGWNPEKLSGDLERGSTFRTRNEAGLETVWVVAEYSPAEGRASYARVALGSNIGLVDVHCVPAAGGGTQVTVRYTLTGLDEAGRAFVEAFLAPEAYRAMIGAWQQLTSQGLARPNADMSHNVY